MAVEWPRRSHVDLVGSRRADSSYQIFKSRFLLSLLPCSHLLPSVFAVAAPPSSRHRLGGARLFGGGWRRGQGCVTVAGGEGEVVRRRRRCADQPPVGGVPAVWGRWWCTSAGAWSGRPSAGRQEVFFFHLVIYTRCEVFNDAT